MAEKTAERQVTVLMPLGLHLRPADMLVKTASGFQSKIELARPGDNERFDAKSILSLLTVAAIQGTELTVRAIGEDAEEAVNEIAKLFADGFGELESSAGE
jgi:phosphotransferase system HPr (HPr) family protein